MRELLEALADGAWHSGADLGRILNVSRTIVWRRIAQLQDQGVLIEKGKGKGYRVSRPLDLLDSELIQASFSNRAMDLVAKIECADSVASTNALALQSLAEDFDVLSALYIAEAQTAGRGRRGRVWQSPFAQNIYMSLTWRFYAGAASLEGLSLAVGIAVARVIERYTGGDLKLKWPNDLLLDGKKLGGILIELTGDPQDLCSLVIGIGLNVYMRHDDSTGIDQAWTSMHEGRSSEFTRSSLIALIVNELVTVLEAYQAQGFGAFVEEWHRYDAFLGRDVFVKVGDQFVPGISCGVNDMGLLRLETSGGERLFNGGEVSLRLSDAAIN